MNDQKTSPIRRCIGYGPHEGKCENEAGTRRGPHWCLRCDKIRLETISKNLSDIMNSFPSNRAITNKETMSMCHLNPELNPELNPNCFQGISTEQIEQAIKIYNQGYKAGHHDTIEGGILILFSTAGQ